MTPGGPAEEAAKVATSFMDIMRAQPLSLALVVMNLALLGLFYYVAAQIAERRANEFNTIMAQQDKINQLFYNCVPAMKQ